MVRRELKGREERVAALVASKGRARRTLFCTYFGPVAYNARQHEIHLQYLPYDGQLSCLQIA